jgi:membrane-bound serine protease (ClpP class)
MKVANPIAKSKTLFLLLFISFLIQASPSAGQFWSDETTTPSGIDFPASVTDWLGKRATRPISERFAYMIEIDGMINPASAEYIANGINAAVKEGAECLILSLDTPGGMLTSTRDIVKDILNAEIPVIVFVSPSGARAGSAGVFITLAAHVAVMEPGTNIGAAHPVMMGGQDIGDKDKDGKEKSDIAKKIINDTLAFVESIATQRGRNVEWAKEAVTESSSITSEKALELNVIDLLAEGITDLLNKIDGREVRLDLGKTTLRTKGIRVEKHVMGLKHRFIDTLANPNIAYILMLIGMMGIYFELSHPGAIFPGVAGAISLILAFVALQTLPFNTAGLLLIGLSIILFILEVYVVSFGMLTIGGLISFVMGSLMIFDTPEMSTGIDPSLIGAATVSLFLFSFMIGYLVLSARSRKVEGGSEGIVGEIGEVRTGCNPQGTIFVHGELWNAVCNEEVNTGDRVKVVKINGLKLEVKKIDDGL